MRSSSNHNNQAQLNSSNIAIKTEDLSKIYNTESGHKLTVINGIDFIVNDREFVSIIGPSGCGKTTLLEIIAGLRDPTSGKIFVYGQEEYEPNSKKGMVFQKDAVFPWYSVKKNVEYGLNLKGWSKEKKEERVNIFLKMVGLNDYENYYPKELSGGMRKRLALAMVFANDPDILFLDEPFGSLDYTTKIELQNELLKLWRSNKTTILFVTHDLEEALYLSDRILILRDKKIINTHLVPFKRPRSSEMRLDKDFRQEVSNLWKYIQ
jgi:NitT/TauT family transport system ATP-binding protein